MGESLLSPGLTGPTFSASLYVRAANKEFICIYFLFLIYSLFCTDSLSRSLSLVPTLSVWPHKERKGSLFVRVPVSLRAAEREAEDIAGHTGPCGGAVTVKWDAIPCNGAAGQHSRDSTDNTHTHTHRQHTRTHRL